MLIRQLTTVLTIAFTIILYAAAAQAPPIQWQRALGGSLYEEATAIEQTADGGYVAIGSTISTNGNITGNHGLQDIWVVKLDLTGTLVWQKCYGGTAFDEGYAIQQTAEGGYIIAGGVNSNNGDVSGNHGAEDLWVAKLDPLGVIQWQKCYGGTSSEVATSIKQTTDKGYFITGASSSNDGDVTSNQGSNDYWLVKIDSLGTLQWQKSYGGTNADIAWDGKETTDKGYIVTGQVSSSNGDVIGFHGGQDYWILKLDSIGNLSWQKTMGGSFTETSFSVQQTADKGYIVGGLAGSTDGDIVGFHGGSNDYWVVKLDSLGLLQWQKCLGGSTQENGCVVRQTTDGGYIAGGSSNSTNGDVTGNHGSHDYWAVKLDSLGTIDWQKSLGGSGGDYANTIQQTADGGYVLAGVSSSTNGDVTGLHDFVPVGDYWIVKLAAPCVPSQTMISIDTCGSYSFAGILRTQNGTYYDTLQSTQSCDSIIVLTLHLHPFPSPVITGDLTTCYSTPSLLTVDSVALYSHFLWSNADTTTSISAVSGSFTIMVTDSFGCTGLSPSVMVVNSSPQVTISGSQQFCPDDSTILIANPSPSAGASYTWSTSDTTISITVGDTGSYAITIAYTNGCTATDTVTVGLFSIIQPVISGATESCNGASVVLATSLPFSGYQWSTSATTDSVMVASGDYTVTATDNNNCTVTSDTFTVSDFNYSLAIGGITEYCFGQSITLEATATPAANAHYQWSTAPPNDSLLTVNTGGSYSLTLSYPNGCTADTLVNVAPPNPLPTPVITGIFLTCYNAPTVLSVDSASLYSNYLWSNADTTSSVSVVSGNYTVTVTDSNACVATSPAVTVTNFSPQVTINGNFGFCPGGSTVLTANPTIPFGVNYTWSTSDNTPSITVNTPGTYYVNITYGNTCTTGDTVTVGLFTTPIADFTISPVASTFEGVPVTVTDASTIASGSVISWLWNFGDNTNVSVQTPSPHVYSSEGEYTISLEVESDNGCWDTISYAYTVAGGLKIPNVFTPNGDGNNDLLLFKNLERFPDSQLVIYNRWGNKIYETSDYQNNWTGDGNSEGVYYYTLTFKSASKESISGFFELLR